MLTEKIDFYDFPFNVNNILVHAMPSSFVEACFKIFYLTYPVCTHRCIELRKKKQPWNYSASPLNGVEQWINSIHKQIFRQKCWEKFFVGQI